MISNTAIRTAQLASPATAMMKTIESIETTQSGVVWF
jgi:hypothetical protein